MLIAKVYIYGYIYFIHAQSVRYYDASNYGIRVRVYDRCVYCDGCNHGISETETKARGLVDLPRQGTINPYIGTELCSGFFIKVFLYPCTPGFLGMKSPYSVARSIGLTFTVSYSSLAHVHCVNQVDV